MAATTTLLGLVTPTQGTLTGTWGDTVNYGISDYVDISVAGTLTLTNDGAVTLANTTGSSAGSNITSSLTGAGTVTAQFAIVRVTGTLTVAKVVTGPSYSKTYTVVNAATGGIVTFKASGQTGVSIAVGESAFVYFNGTDYVKVSGTASVNSFSAGTTGLTPSTATTGAVTLAGTLITSNGGTGLSSYTAGDLTYFATGTTFTKLAIGTAGQFLTSSGTAPQWSTLSGVAVTTLSFGTTGLTPATATSGAITVAGTLATTNGGTGLTSFTANRVFYASSSSAIGSSANLTFNGTTFNALAITENGYAVVSQADIGTADNEIPLNQYLGSMAYQNGTDYYNVGMTVGFRNRIINGAMVIDQRNSGSSFSAVNGSYSLDRWQTTSFDGGAVTGKYTVQQNAGSVTPPSGFSKYLGVTSSAATTISVNSIYAINQYIEGLNVADLAWGTSAAKPVTVSFWVRSSLTGTFGGAIANNAADRVYGFTYAINTASTWEYKTVTIAGDTTGTWLTTNGIGVQVSFGLGGGVNWSAPAGQWTTSISYTADDCVSVVSTSGATWYITGVQFEVGTQATQFDWRPYGTELFLCQRYFEKTTYVNGDYVGAAGFALTAGAAYFTYACAVEKRATPTWISSGGFRGQGLADTGTSTSYSASNTSNRAVNLVYSASYSGTNGQVVLLQSMATGAYLQASAEL